MSDRPIIFKASFRPDTFQCDVNGNMRLSSVIDIIQSIAIRHFKLFDAGRDDLAEKGITWVLFKTVVEMNRYPRIDEDIEVETFIAPEMLNFIPRYYLMRDRSGCIVGKAGSFWVLMDRKSRKAVHPTEIGLSFLSQSKQDPTINLLVPCKEPEGERLSSCYLPKYSDIDVNGHVNNSRYIDWLCDELGLELLRDRMIGQITVEYSREVLSGMTLKNELVLNGDSFLFSGSFEGKKLFSIHGTLKSIQ